MRTIGTMSAVALLAGLGASAGFAQAPKQTVPPAPPAKTAQQPPPVDSEPQNTSATYGDWLERCQKLPAGSEVARACEVAQSIQVQGQNGPVAEVAVGRIKKGDPMHLTLVLPVNVLFPSAPKLVVDGAEQDGLELAWKRCVPGGCFADAVFKDDQMKRWKASAVAGKILSKDSTGRDIAIAVSFRGFAQALDALAKEP